MRHRSLIVAFLALCLSFLAACSSSPEANDRSLTYDDILNTGLANNCPTLEDTNRSSIPLDASQAYTLTQLCLQPTDYFVKEEATNARKQAEFVPGKPLTRKTSSLTQISGNLTFEGDGKLTFEEEDGIDFQAITVLLPGGEEVPFFFTIKGLVATTSTSVEAINTSTDFEGGFRVPSYRGGNFLDPKGRGAATGYDSAVALPPASELEEYNRSNKKRTAEGKGEISLQITKVDSATGEVAGIFESVQPSDTDLGAKDAVDVKIRGNFYGLVDVAS